MKTSIKILVLIACVVAVQSCDYLEKPGPSTQISQEEALGTAAGVKSVRAYMYTQLHSFAYTTNYFLAPSSLADGMYITSGSNRYSGLNKNTPGTTVNTNDGTTTFWDESYEIIQQANLLIHAVKPGVISDALLKQYRGEAYFIRAFVYFQMARTYGYEPGVTPNFGQGQGFKLAVPIRTKPVLNPSDAVFLSRATEEQVYELVESDLMKAINLLSQGDAGKVYYPSKAAAEALLARVYLYWHSKSNHYKLADKYATAALEDSPAKLAKASQVGTLFNAGSTVEVIFQGLIDNQATESQGVNDALAAYTSEQWMAQAPTQDLMDLYDPDDARLAWFAPCFNDVAGEPETCLATYPTIKDGGVTVELQKWNGDLGNYADNLPYLRAAEMVLIQVEARLHTMGVSAAVDRLNYFRHHRGEGDYSGAMTEDAVMHAILIERRKEFIGEGQRFFDLKRLGMSIRKAPETLDDPGVSKVPFSSRLVLPKIPVGAVQLSQSAADNGLIPQDSVLVQNPGY